MEKHDLAKLETKIKDLAAQLGSLTAPPHAERAANKPVTVDDLLPIIHRPGWTTVAEFTLVNGIVDAMLAHTKAISTLQQTLLGGAAAIGVAK